MLATVAAISLLDYGVPYLLFIAKSLGRKIPPKELRDNVLYVIPIFGLPITKFFQNVDIEP